MLLLVLLFSFAPAGVLPFAQEPPPNPSPVASVTPSPEPEGSAHGKGAPTPAPAPASALRFFALGDGGTAQPDQYRVAGAVLERCRASGCDFGLLLGDNIYPAGVTSPTDAQWAAKFEQPYAGLIAAGIPFYAVLGNHDSDDGKDFARADHQVAYSAVNPAWRMPARHYVFAEKAVLFLAIDTMAIVVNHQGADVAQRGMVREALAGGGRIWTVAFGHHAYRSNSTNGNAPPRLARFVEEELCGKAELYLAGHDHNLQVLEPPKGCPTLFVVSGGGGYETYPVGGSNPALFQARTLGFAYVVIDGRQLTLEFYDAAGTLLFTHTVAK